MNLRVEFFYDDESHNWSYRVPSLHIIGGGTETREEAEAMARESILFTLEGDENEPVPAGNEVAYFRVSIEPAPHPVEV